MPWTLRLGLALAGVALAIGCGTTQTALPSIAADAPLRYSTYCDTPGHVRGESWALALIGHPSHREEVYRQAAQGLYPASEVWLHLESVCHDAGGWTAEDHAGPRCALLPPELGCEFNWNPVRSLMPGAGQGRERLLAVFKEGYDARWEQVKRGYHARAELTRAGMLMAGVALGRTPAAAEGQAAATEEQAAAAERRALGAEARAGAAEAGSEGTSPPGLVSAETLGLSRALGAEEASALETRLLELEAESPGTRESFSAEELRNGRLAPRARPSEVTEESALWREFEAYRQRRFHEVRARWGSSSKGTLSVKPPLRWESYQQFREHFQRCHQFESKVGGVLVHDMELPPGSRRVLRDSRQPLLARNVGTKKPGQTGLRYPDYLAVDEATLEEDSVPRVESVSVKRRNFLNKNAQEVERQVRVDTQEALNQYGGNLEVRRPGHPLYGRTVQVFKVHLVYEADIVGDWKGLIQRICREAKVEVYFE
jgi:hypothetical protein